MEEYYTSDYHNFIILAKQSSFYIITGYFRKDGKCVAKYIYRSSSVQYFQHTLLIIDFDLLKEEENNYLNAKVYDKKCLYENVKYST